MSAIKRGNKAKQSDDGKKIYVFKPKQSLARTPPSKARAIAVGDQEMTTERKSTSSNRNKAWRERHQAKPEQSQWGTRR
ncbi:hypothetical protein QE152_g34806 [Popillia japonica]|uniref:Uncharacterized protein n=1 Tax=Popillia japonica TaxID=7064 RepID=A0AAW1ITM7_POPJA